MLDFGDTCNVVTDVKDIIVEDVRAILYSVSSNLPQICNFIEVWMGSVIRSCPRMPKPPLAHYGGVGMYI